MVHKSLALTLAALAPFCLANPFGKYQTIGGQVSMQIPGTDKLIKCNNLFEGEDSLNPAGELCQHIYGGDGTLFPLYCPTRNPFVYCTNAWFNWRQDNIYIPVDDGSGREGTVKDSDFEALTGETFF